MLTYHMNRQIVLIVQIFLNLSCVTGFLCFHMTCFTRLTLQLASLAHWSHLSDTNSSACFYIFSFSGTSRVSLRTVTSFSETLSLSEAALLSAQSLSSRRRSFWRVLFGGRLRRRKLRSRETDMVRMTKRCGQLQINSSIFTGQFQLRFLTTFPVSS